MNPASLAAASPYLAPPALTHLQLLKAESIHILREVAAEFERPVMLYSIGKNSSVMLRLAQKAFHPGPIPLPLLHIDTGGSKNSRSRSSAAFSTVTLPDDRTRHRTACGQCS